MRGTCEVVWVDSRASDEIPDITMEEARLQVDALRRDNPHLWISATWYGPNKEEVSFDPEWEDDDFSDWKDETDDDPDDYN